MSHRTAAPLRGAALSGGRRSLRPRRAPPCAAAASSLHADSNREALLLPWSASASPRAEGGPPIVSPRFPGQYGEPTDPMALLMRERIVFLGTQARRLRGVNPMADKASRG